MPNEKSIDRLIKLCLKGKRQAQFKFYELHEVFLFGICMRYAKSVAEAEDILQEAFVKIFKDLHQYSGKAPIKAWMRKVTVNTALMHIRKYKKLRFEELSEDSLQSMESHTSILNLTDRADLIIQLVRKLPQTQQTVFNLKTMDGYSFPEISNILDCNENTLRSHYLRARKTLQKMLTKELN